MFAIVFGALGIIFSVLAFTRMIVVDMALEKRFKEVYDSDRWYMYPLDVGGTYDKYMWDLRKWTYRSIFPEEVK